MACSSFRALLFWCREMLLVLFCQQQQQPSISHQFSSISSLGLYFISSRVSEVTLGTFSMRFCGMFVILCLSVLVPGGAFGTLLSAAAAATAISHQFPQVFNSSRVSEVMLGSLSLRIPHQFYLSISLSINLCISLSFYLH